MPTINHPLPQVVLTLVNFRLASLASGMQKIEIASLVSLGYVRRAQGTKATRVPGRLRFPRRASPGQHAIIDTESEFSLGHIQFDQIAMLHEREWPSGK